MSMTKVITGFSAFFRGGKVIAKHQLWSYIVLPAFLSLVVGIVLLFSFYHFFSSQAIGQLLQWLTTKFSWQWAASGSGLLWITRILAAVLAFILYIILYAPVASLVVIPFLGYLLARLEKIYLGQAIEISTAQDIKNIFLGFLVNLKYSLLSIFTFFLGLFLGPFQPVLVIGVNGYILGRGSYEFLLEKDFASLRERSHKAKPMKAKMLGLGMAQLLFLLIPVVGILLSSCFALAGAFLLYYGIGPDGKQK